MNQTDVMLAVVEYARIGGTMAPEDAIPVIARLIDGLDVSAENYEQNVSALMELGATIWSLAQIQK